jgi:hypothetical protein
MAQELPHPTRGGAILMIWLTAVIMPLAAPITGSSQSAF